MTKAARTLTVLVLNSVVGLLSTPVAAQQAAQSASAVCKEDVVCVDSTTVHTWPLDRWTTVRQADRRTAAAK